MPRQRGKTLDLTFSYQRIDKAISSLNGECFTPKIIHEITGVNRVSIRVFIFYKTKKGFLEKIRPGCYRKVSVSDGDLTKRLPSAFLATKVWEILRQSDKPLLLREISEIITENTGFNSYFSIGPLLLKWLRRNVLDKLGSKQPYAYQIKPDYKDKDRPSSGPPF